MASLMEFMKQNGQLAPFAAMEQYNVTTACKCASGYHSVIQNNLWGGSPSCSCQPDGQPDAHPVTNPKCDALNANAPIGYKYIYNGVGCVLVVDYDSNAIKYPSNAPLSNIPILSSLPSSVTDIWANHKFAVLAVLGLGSWYLFSGGLAASDRTITSVTRFAPRKRNGRRNKKRKNRR